MGRFATRARTELWILERSIGGFDAGAGFDERSESGTMRVQSRELSFLPATVIASERMNANLGWRLLESGELVHVDSGPPGNHDDRCPGPARTDDGGLSAQEAVA